MLDSIQKILQRKKKAMSLLQTLLRISFVIGLGTTGKRAVAEVRRMVPSLRGSTIAVDGEVSREEEMEDDDLVVIPDAPVADFLSKKDSNGFLSPDPLISTVRIPHETEKGAGTCRLIGTLKGAFVLEQFTRKLNRSLRRRLAKIQDQDRRPVIDVHIVAAAGGGLGSALIIPATLLIRDLVRRLCPGARCNVTLHLFMAAHFEERIADHAIRDKIRANDFANLLEINWAQDPSHVSRLYELLGCQPLPVPTFDRVVPYEVSNEQGATLPLEQVISDRLLPNIIAGECGALQNRLRELASNTAAKNAAQRALVHPMVSACQAAAAVVPQHLGHCWALRDTMKLLAATLAKPSTERLKALEDPAKTMLEVEAMKTEVGRVSGEAIAHSLTVAKTARSKTSAQAYQSLTETLARYDSSVRPGTEAKLGALAQHYEEVAIPDTLQRLVNSLIDRGATLSEIVMTGRGLERGLIDFADRVEKELEKASASLKGRRDEFNGLIRKLSGNPALSGSLKERAATALNDVVKADEVVLRHRALRTLTRHLRQQVSDLVHELETTHRAAQKVWAAMKRRYAELRELATVQTTTYRSIIRPEEFDEAMKRLDAGIRAANESIPTIDLKGLIAGGNLGLHDQLDAFVEERVTFFHDYFEAHLTDLTGTVKSLRVSFSLEKWIDSTTRSLACSMAVRMSATPHGAEPQTVIVGCGDDLESVKQVLRQRPTLANIETIQGTDPTTVFIDRRMVGLTIEATSSFHDAKRAAQAFPKPGPGLTAWEILCSSGHLLDAFEQAGLVPEEWLPVAREAQAPRRAARPVTANGDTL